MSFLIFILGLVTLVAGGEFFIKGSSRLAALLGMPPLVIGLTVVSFGTSAPELGVSVQAALDGYATIALGNVTGSNIFNVLGVLGLSALAAPLLIHTNLVKFDVPVMIVVSLLLGTMAYDGEINRVEGLFLMMCAAIYTWVLIKGAQQEKKKDLAEGAEEFATKKDLKSVLLIFGFISIGLALLVFGARWTVEGAIEIAKAFSISERVIAVTIVAVGTSLPELVTSVMASLRGERDMAVGNVVGSNIYNILIILGLASAISPVGIAVDAASLTGDMPIVIAAAALCLPFFMRKTMHRWVGALFVGLYVGYVVYILNS
jgi:cation:H+ antiporter